MTLMNLPAEVILIIIKYLDLKSIESLYNTSRYMRDIVRMQGAVKKCCMSMTTMASVKVFKTEFFKDISGHLQELDLCAVPDLYRTAFYPALKLFKSLITLDVSYSYLNLDNLRIICKLCPTLKNISININMHVPKDLLSLYQDDFQRLENVNFVGSLMYYDSAIQTLEKANIDTLKYTVLGRFNKTLYKKAKCKQLGMYFFNIGNRQIHSLNYLPSLSSKNTEYFVINKSTLSKYTVYTSLLLRRLFSDEFGLDTDFIDINKPLKGNTAITFFDKDNTKFDEFFFSKLLCEVKQYLPYYCQSNTEISSSTILDWFYITPKAQDIKHNCLNKDDEPVLKRKRIGEPNFVLDYDVIFKQKQNIKLSIGFKDHNIRNAVALSATSEYLKKLTFISLSGRISYSSNFFNILFKNCINLAELDIESHHANPQATLDIAKHIPSSKCLKHFRLLGSGIKFNTLFTSLSQCKKLEKVHIDDSATYTLWSNEIPTEFGDPSILIEKCDHLSSLYVNAPIPQKAKLNISKKLNTLKVRLGKYYLIILFDCKVDDYGERFTIKTYPSDALPFDLFRTN